MRREPQGPARALQMELRRALNAACRKVEPDQPSIDGAAMAARRLQRTKATELRADFQRGAIHASALGRGLSDLADISIDLLLREAIAQQGAGCSITVLALGKYGGRELTATSDLDLVFVCEDLGPDAAYACTRLARALLNGLTAATEEGLLYDVDVRLRPHGEKGGLVSPLSSFARYYDEEAWTWELMALTRLRPIAGNAELGARARNAARLALTKPRRPDLLLQDIAQMRARLDNAHPAVTTLDVKHGPGGMMDIEFAAQAGMLLSAQTPTPIIEPQTRLALRALEQRKFLTAEHAEILSDALTLFSALQHAQRAADPGEDPYGGRRAETEKRVRALRPRVRDILLQVLAAPAAAAA